MALDGSPTIFCILHLFCIFYFRHFGVLIFILVFKDVCRVWFFFCFRLFVLLIISLTDVYRVCWLPFGVFFVLAKPLKHFELVVCLKGTIEKF